MRGALILATGKFFFCVFFNIVGKVRVVCIVRVGS
jgi:hypothetical protein